MVEILNETEARVIGSLVEKQLTTPEYYPLTLNALVNACNQKSNRDPIVNYDESTVTTTLERLRDRNLVYVFYGSTSRVPKYKHMLPSVYELDPAEVAVMCVMLLRGPQTIGELKIRTERLYGFEGLMQIQETLDNLARREDPLVLKLERQPGQKEARYAHLLSGPIDIESYAVAAAASPRSHSGADSGRIEKLEQEVERLSTELASFRETFNEFRKQFE